MSHFAKEGMPSGPLLHAHTIYRMIGSMSPWVNQQADKVLQKTAAVYQTQ